MARTNVAYPNIALTVTSEGTEAAIAKIQGQFTGMVSGIQGQLTSITSTASSRLEKYAEGLGTYLDKVLNKHAMSMSRGTISPKIEAEIGLVQQLAGAWGEVETARTAAAMKGVAEAMNLSKQVDLTKQLAQLQSRSYEQFKAGNFGQPVDAGNIIGRLTAAQAAQAAAIAAERAARANFRMGDMAGGFAGDRGDIISRLSGHSAAEREAVAAARANFRMGDMGAGQSRLDPMMARLGEAERERQRQIKAEALAGSSYHRFAAGDWDQPQDSGGMISRLSAHSASQRTAEERRLDTLYTIQQIRDQGPASYLHSSGMGYRLQNQPEPPVRPNLPDPRPIVSPALRPSTPESRFAAMDLGSREFQGPRILPSNEEAYARYRNQRYGEHTVGSSMGRLTSENSNRFRFGAQNIGFGVDDAIQSYQYGGARASIRAASNNATAIAGMLITSPVIAAASVIALSAGSAVLPMIIDRYWAQTGVKPLTADEHAANQLQRFEGERSTNSHYGEYMSKSSAGLATSAEYSAVLAEQFKSHQAGSDLDIQGERLRKEQAQLEDGRKHAFVSYVRQRIQNSPGIGHLNKSLSDEEIWTGNFKQVVPGAVDQARFAANAGSMFGDQFTEPMKANQKAREDFAKVQETHNNKQAEIDRKVELYKQEVENTRQQQLARSISERQFSEASARGEHVPGGASAAIAQMFTQRRESITHARMSGSSRKLAIENLEQEQRDRMSDPEMLERQAALGRNNYERNSQSYYASVSGDGSRVASAYNTAYQRNAGLSSDFTNRILSPEEYNKRRTASDAAFTRDRRHGFEDDIEELNPEQNPLRRQLNALHRRTEKLSLEEGNLTPEEKRQKALALLKRTERDREEFKPSGHRSYISSGYRVDSKEDMELEARMTGNFGPGRIKGRHDGKTLQEILMAILELNKTLSVEAALLDR